MLARTGGAVGDGIGGASGFDDAIEKEVNSACSRNDHMTAGDEQTSRCDFSMIR